MEGLGRLAWGIGHDFNNVLSTVLCYSRLVERQLPEAGAAIEDVAEIRAAAMRGQELARLLLAFARRPSFGRLLPVDLGRQVEYLLRLLQHNFGDFVTFRFSAPIRPVPISIDIVTFSEMLLELLVAAKRSLPSGGEIVLDVADRFTEAGEGVGDGNCVAPGTLAAGPCALITLTLTSRGSGDDSRAALAGGDERSVCCWPGPILLSLIDNILTRTGCRIEIGSRSEPTRSLELYVPMASVV